VTRVDFYVLPETALSVGTAARDGALGTVCKLCDKASQAATKTFVFAPDHGTASALDSILWTFRQGSFIAHERLGPVAPESPAPDVLIGDAEPPSEWQGLMINLAPAVPPFFSRFERVIEIVDGDAEERARSRERYKFYRDRGYELTMHKL